MWEDVMESRFFTRWQLQRWQRMVMILPIGKCCMLGLACTGKYLKNVEYYADRQDKNLCEIIKSGKLL